MSTTTTLLLPPPGHIARPDGTTHAVTGFGPSPTKGRYEFRRCDACYAERVCRYVRGASLWLCNSKNRCYARRYWIVGRAKRGEELRG